MERKEEGAIIMTEEKDTASGVTATTTTTANMATTARSLLDSELKVVNIGLEIFHNALKLQNIKVVDVNWSPPPKLDKETEDLLDKIL
jgi:hypothetical protein